MVKTMHGGGVTGPDLPTHEAKAEESGSAAVLRAAERKRRHAKRARQRGRWPKWRRNRARGAPSVTESCLTAAPREPARPCPELPPLVLATAGGGFRSRPAQPARVRRQLPAWTSSSGSRACWTGVQDVCDDILGHGPDRFRLPAPEGEWDWHTARSHGSRSMRRDRYENCPRRPSRVQRRPRRQRTGDRATANRSGHDGPVAARRRSRRCGCGLRETGAATR